MGCTYIIAQGDTLPAIAARFGFADWNTIYNLPENASFRELRPNPNLLHPGDELYLPDRTPGEFSKPTDELHKFVCHRPTQVLRLALASADPDGGDTPSDGTLTPVVRKPRANVQYEVHVQDRVIKGTTDGDGRLEVTIPADAATARLVIPGASWDLDIGSLNPVVHPTADEGLSGAQARLKNLGYFNGAADGAMNPETEQALRWFQSENGLEITGSLDDSTKSKLSDIHGT